MKKLIATVIAIIAILVMTVPAMAVDTAVEIGTGGGGGGTSGTPYVVAKFETPDEVAGDGVQILPEAPVPNFGTATTDGWKQINFYIVIDDPQGDADITGADIIVRYPDGEEKFNLSVQRNRFVQGPYCDTFGPYAWSVDGGPGPEVYPTGAPANPPAPEVRELRYRPAGNWTDDDDADGKLDGIVDGDADGDTDNNPPGSDLSVPEWLAYYGSLVKYGNDPYDTNFNATKVTDLLVEVENDGTGKCIMLEIISYIWCHQDPVQYRVEASAIAGVQSPTLNNNFTFVPQAHLYLDFNMVDWGNVSPPTPPLQMSYANKDGDRNLLTALLPTIWNNGNYCGQVYFYATKLLLDGNLANDQDGKRIVTYDVGLNYLGSDNSVIQLGKIVYIAQDIVIDPTDMGKLITEWTNPSIAICLPPCTPTQIDFSLGVPTGLVNGDYEGDIVLTIANYVGECPADPSDLE